MAHTDRLQGATEYETAYLRDVLDCDNEGMEKQMFDRLIAEALELRVHVDTQPEPKPPSSRTFSSIEPPRRSESIDSRASQSTGLTSNFSGLSRGALRTNGRRRSRASLSFRDYDNFMARGTSNGRTSMSFSSPTTPSHSTFSLPLFSPEASPKGTFRKIRGLSMLRLHRMDSASSAVGCPHCPQDFLSQRRAVHRLPCGHRLCTSALRNTIRSATESQSGAVPSCCGVPVPGKLVEHVMTQDEQNALLDKLDQWDEAASIAPSVTSEIKASTSSQKEDTGNHKISSESKVDSVGPRTHTSHEMQEILERPEYKQLLSDQIELRGRFLLWIDGQRAQLAATQDDLRTEMKCRHETSVEDTLEGHGGAMAEAEDKQVKAESDMRELHEQEKRDNSTALKHMQAYCAGLYRTGEEHNRTVTDQDRSELEKTMRIRDTMDTKHSSAINVLRGEQGRRIKLRAQRQEKEIQELMRSQRKEELELERSCNGEAHRLDGFVAEKRRKLKETWELQVKILVKRIEVETGTAIKGTFPNLEWHSEPATGLSGGC